MDNKRPTYRGQAREIAQHVLTKCQEEGEKNRLMVPLSQPVARTAYLTGLSQNVILKIQKGDLTGVCETETKNDKSKSGKRRGPCRWKKKIIPEWQKKLDDFDLSVIKRAVNEAQVKSKELPSVSKLLTIVQKEVKFSISDRATLHKVLRHIGFRWMKIPLQRSVLVENPDMVYARGKYLMSVRAFVEEGRPIFYLGETCLERDPSTSTMKKSKSEGSSTIPENGVPGTRFYLVHIGGQRGFLPNTHLIAEGESLIEEGYDHGITSDVFEEWILKKVLPQLSPESVVVTRKAPYLDWEPSPVPSRYASKDEMFEWLAGNGIQVNSTLRRAELYEYIIPYKPKEKFYKLETILRDAGHSMVRLAQFMGELSPIDRAWNKIKQILSQKRTWTQEQVVAAINSVSASDWEDYYQLARSLEDMYWNMDEGIEEIVDNLTEMGGKVKDGSSDSDWCELE